MLDLSAKVAVAVFHHDHCSVASPIVATARHGEAGEDAAYEKTGNSGAQSPQRYCL